jgi:formylglycine-generating enzyme required for sulfatase activity
LAGFMAPSPALTDSPTVTPDASAAGLTIGSEKTSDIDGMVVVYVTAGDFTMGFDRGNKKDMAPGHTITLDGFWIDRTEVTNAQYAKCVSAGVCDEPQDLTSHNRVKYYNGDQYAAFPMVNISWNEAQVYCRWAGRVLPTEAQWEKSARAADGRIYPWGDEVPSPTLANYGKPLGDTIQTGSLPDGASQFGALDMAGNVREWTADWYDEAYYKTSPKENPAGPIAGYKRSARGGSWGDDISNIRVFIRWGLIPITRSNNLGFRCAMPG